MFTHKTSNARACKAVAVLLHFSVLCMFSMMAVACSELHRAIVHVFDRTKKRRLRKYAWLIAAGKGTDNANSLVPLCLCLLLLDMLSQVITCMACSIGN